VFCGNYYQHNCEDVQHHSVVTDVMREHCLGEKNTFITLGSSYFCIEKFFFIQPVFQIFHKVTTVVPKKKAKAVPLTRHGGTWRERRYSSYSFSTSALDVGEWSASRPGRALPRRKDPRYPLYGRLGGPQNRSGHRG
jgi:hypothetical protein